jgi:hypothetical protein
MRCERCQGLGRDPRSEPTGPMGTFPCIECQGMGITHCCDGLREQPANDDKPSGGHDVSGCPDNTKG